MKVLQKGESELELSELDAQGFSVESTDPALHFGAVELFITSLGLCSFAVLSTYGDHAGVDPSPVRMTLRWHYDDDPFRIAGFSMDIRWPGLPESRREAARRAAEQCTLHHTLGQPPQMETRVVDSDG